MLVGAATPLVDAKRAAIQRLGISQLDLWSIELLHSAGWASPCDDGTTTAQLTPPTSDVLTGVQAIAAGYAHTCALIWPDWRWHRDGQLDAADQ